MRSRVLAFGAAGLLSFASTAQGQYLKLPRYGNGPSFKYFLHADINRDGKTDIIGIRSSSPGEEITVLLGNGTGGFSAPIDTAVSGVDNVDTRQLLLGDFNGDGLLDVAVFGTDHVTGQAAVAVMLGNGNGTFQAGQDSITVKNSFTSPSLFCRAHNGDYNGDGKLDIAYLTQSPNSVVVLPGKGDGTFSAPVTTSLGFASFSCLASGDFNKDKKLDLALSSSYGSAIMLGNGDGTFQSPNTLPKVGTYIVAADLNGDGNVDLVGEQLLSEPTVTVLLGDGSGSFPTTHTYAYDIGNASNAFLGPFALQDLNGDGKPDIVMFGGTPSARIIFTFLNNGDGSFTPGKKLYVGDGVTYSIGLVAADLNGDGKPDLAFSNAVGGISVMKGNGDGTFQANFATPAFGDDLRVGDFNNDLKPDLLLIGQSCNVLLGNGDGTFTPVNAVCAPAYAIGDFNGDGKLDLAYPVPGSNGGVQVYLGYGDGGFAGGGLFDQGVKHELTLAGDFNNDHKLDLAASDMNGFSILLGNGDGTFQNGIPSAVSASFPSFVTGDFNGDGKLDVAAETSSGIAVFLGKGDGTFAAPIVSSGPAAGYMTVFDLNKDGKRDLLITSGLQLTVLLGKGDGTFQPPVQYALPSSAGTRAISGDFNRDGKLDVAVGDSSGMVDIFFGDGTGKLLTPPSRFEAGGAPAGIATADFNKDGKPDLAVSLGTPFSTVNGFVVTLLHQ
jgi:hypothetical protein